MDEWPLKPEVLKLQTFAAEEFTVSAVDYDRFVACSPLRNIQNINHANSCLSIYSNAILGDSVTRTINPPILILP